MKLPPNGSWPANGLLVLGGMLLGGTVVGILLFPEENPPAGAPQSWAKNGSPMGESYVPPADSDPDNEARPTARAGATPTLDSALKLLDPQERSAALRLLGAAMAQADLAAALRHGAALDRPQDRLDFLRGVFGEWSEIDPEGAALHAWRHFEPGQLRTEVVSLVVNKWGAENPNAAWLWINQHLNGPTREQAMTDLMIGWTRRTPREAANWLTSTGLTSNALYSATALTWAEQDPEEALIWTAGLPPSRARLAARNIIAGEYARQDPEAAAAAFAEDLQTAENKLELANILASVRATDDPVATAAWLDTLPPGAVQAQAAGTLATVWATYDVAAAVAWVEQMENPELRRRVVTNLATTWGGIEPGEAIDWLLSLPADDSADGLGGALNSWAATDAIGLYNWIHEVPDSGLADLARRSLGDVISQEDMFGAMDLALSLTDADLRTDTLSRYFRYWQRSDPASAEEWLMLYGPGLELDLRKRLQADQRRVLNPAPGNGG